MDWDWEAIEAISSVIGGVFVLVSIIFLVLEIRHNAKAIEGATVQSLMSLEREVFALLADHADLVTRGCESYSGLSTQEKYQFERVAGAQLSLTYSAHVQLSRDLMELEVWEAYLNALKRYTAKPGFVECWEVIKNNYPATFRTMVDKTAIPKV